METIISKYYAVSCYLILLLCQNCHNNPFCNVESLSLAQQPRLQNKAHVSYHGHGSHALFTPASKSGSQPRMHVRNPWGTFWCSGSPLARGTSPALSSRNWGFQKSSSSPRCAARFQNPRARESSHPPSSSVPLCLIWASGKLAPQQNPASPV